MGEAKISCKNERIVMSTDAQARIMKKLFREKFISGGHAEAILFAFNCEANVERIKAEIAERKQLIYDRLQNNPHGGMAEGNSPRLYQDGFIAGLEKALEIIAAETEAQEPSNTQPDN